MQHIRLYLIVLLTGLLVSSCFKKEQAVAPFQGSVAIIPNNVGYFQSYYDFENDTVIASNAIGDWELGIRVRKEWLAYPGKFGQRLVCMEQPDDRH